MIFDNNLKVADNLPVLASKVTDAVYLGAKDITVGEPVPFAIVVDETFNNLTSLTMLLQTCADNTFATDATTTISEQVFERVKLVENAILPPTQLPKGAKGYLRAKFEVTGTSPTTGKITAGVVDAVEEGYDQL